MNCIAHRGFAGVNAENTLPAVRDGAARADGVEVDLRRCGSGEVVVLHDATLDRTTDGSGPVGEATAAQLDALDVEGSGAGVPTLEAVLEAMPAASTLHAELKERGLAEDLERAVAAAADPPDVVVSSFDPAALTAVSAFPTALLVTNGEEAVDRALELDCDGLHPPVDVCTADLVAAAHSAGLTVNVWTVTDSAETARLSEMGVDGVITDYPNCCPSAVE